MTYTEIKLRAKIEYLRRLLGVYVKLMKHFNDVELNVDTNSGMVEVKYTTPKGDWWDFESKEFPITDLNKQIRHYRNKVNIAFKNREKKQDR